MRINGKLDYSNNPTLTELLERKQCVVKGYKGAVHLTWAWNGQAKDDQAVQIEIDGKVAIVDKQDLLYALRAVPEGKVQAEELESWQSQT